MTNASHSHIPTFSGAFRTNLDAMIDLFKRGDKGPAGKTIGFELERILIDRTGTPVPFEGKQGVGALLERIAKEAEAQQGTCERMIIDGHLLGVGYTHTTALEPVAVTVSLEPAAQLEVSVGPGHTVRALFEAVEAFDQLVADALATLELDARLVAIGYNPCVAQPEELELIPKDRYHAMDAYLSRRGRYARDMMRCTASTQVSLDYETEQDAQRIYRMATLLGPAFAFLFDNAPVFRGEPAPSMARSRIWHHVDVDRCGIVPGALEGLTFEDYILWVSSIKPILFTNEQHVTTTTGERYTRDIMSERPLAPSELMHLLSMVFPNVRLKGFVELREMDSLPPRLAAACTSFTGALFYDKCLERKLAKLLRAWLPRGFDDIDENDAVLARLQLEEHGWEACPYGVPMPELARALTTIAKENVQHGTCCGEQVTQADGEAVAVPVVSSTPEAQAFDLEGIEMLEQLWRWRKLPRDMGHQELLDMLARKQA